MIPWVAKYKPQKLSDIPQQGVSELQGFVETFSKQKKKALIIYGPTGSCKTVAVHLLARHLNKELIEVNASDFRNEEQIELKVGNALKQQSLFSTGKIVLVDEVDGIAGRQDYGGVSALAKLIENAKFPVIMTANDPWDKKFSSLRSKSVLVEFQAIQPSAISSVLQNICEKESVNTEPLAIAGIAHRSGGDLRAAINDTQALAHLKKISKEDLSSLGERNKEESMFNALIKILKNSDAKIAVEAFEHVDEDFDHCMLWLEENIPKEYSGRDLSQAFEHMSRADVFKGRIQRWQHWRFLVYIKELITAGVASAKSERSKAFVKYSPPQRLLKIWRAKMKYAKRNSIAEKIAQKTHCSSAKSLSSFLPYLQPKTETGQQIIKELELDEEEIEWLNKS